MSDLEYGIFLGLLFVIWAWGLWFLCKDSGDKRWEVTIETYQAGLMRHTWDRDHMVPAYGWELCIVDTTGVRKTYKMQSTRSAQSHRDAYLCAKDKAKEQVNIFNAEGHLHEVWTVKLK